MIQGPGSVRRRHRIVLAAGLVRLVFLTISVGPLCSPALFPRPLRYRVLVGTLQVARAAHGVLLVAVPAAAGAMAIALGRGRRRGARRPGLARKLGVRRHQQEGNGRRVQERGPGVVTEGGPRGGQGR
jgi:hypothetical protein